VGYPVVNDTISNRWRGVPSRCETSSPISTCGFRKQHLITHIAGFLGPGNPGLSMSMWMRPICTYIRTCIACDPY
jgi:hypothetical protein